MKRTASTVLLIAVGAIASSISLALSADMKGMDMKNMEMKQGMDMKGMEMEKKPSSTTHKAIGVVKKADSASGTVKLSHEPVKSLNWPAMDMDFKVADKMLFDKLKLGEKVEITFSKKGKDYVISSVK